MDVLELAKEIIAGKRLGRNDDLSEFITCDLDSLCKGADEIRKHFVGDKVDLCTIINGKSGRCPEDCKYCAQSCHNKTGVEEYGVLPVEKILEEARLNQEGGADRFAVVTAGKAPTGKDFDKLILAYETMNRELDINLCASMGFLSREQFRRLRAAGVTSYHDNIETSRNYFPKVCTTHTYDQKIETIKLAQEEGFCVCSGGIIGMGESWEDRLDMAMSLYELGIKSIPINSLMPIKGTPFENMESLSNDDILRTIAFFRYINPEANVRLAAGRTLLYRDGYTAFQSGASASITGNMLTTCGSNIVKDKEMLKELGRISAPSYGTTCYNCKPCEPCGCDSCCAPENNCSPCEPSCCAPENNCSPCEPGCCAPENNCSPCEPSCCAPEK